MRHFRREEELTEKEKNIADIRTSVQVLQKFKHSYISAKLHHIDIMTNFSNCHQHSFPFCPSMDHQLALNIHSYFFLFFVTKSQTILVSTRLVTQSETQKGIGNDWASDRMICTKNVQPQINIFLLHLSMFPPRFTLKSFKEALNLILSLQNFFLHQNIPEPSQTCQFTFSLHSHTFNPRLFYQISTANYIFLNKGVRHSEQCPSATLRSL